MVRYSRGGGRSQAGAASAHELDGRVDAMAHTFPSVGKRITPPDPDL